jgi:predicted nuclease of predicted toxin-antitoxin system
MRLLIDECVDPRVKTLLPDHEPVTVREKGWSSLDDSALLAAAAREFDVLLTIDRKMRFQQNLRKLRIGIIVVRVPKNQIAYYRAIANEIADAMSGIRKGEVIEVGTL